MNSKFEALLSFYTNFEISGECRKQIWFNDPEFSLGDLMPLELVNGKVANQSYETVLIGVDSTITKALKEFHLLICNSNKIECLRLYQTTIRSLEDLIRIYVPREIAFLNDTSVFHPYKLQDLEYREYEKILKPLNALILTKLIDPLKDEKELLVGTTHSAFLKTIEFCADDSYTSGYNKLSVEIIDFKSRLVKAFDKLATNNFVIDDGINRTQFYKIFNEKFTGPKIVWTGSLASLKYFVNQLRSERVIFENRPHLKTALLFLNKDSELHSKTIRTTSPLECSAQQIILDSVVAVIAGLR